MPRRATPEELRLYEADRVTCGKVFYFAALEHWLVRASWDTPWDEAGGGLLLPSATPEAMVRVGHVCYRTKRKHKTHVCWCGARKDES